jgi:hypothetical protein
VTSAATRLHGHRHLQLGNKGSYYADMKVTFLQSVLALLLEQDVTKVVEIMGGARFIWKAAPLYIALKLDTYQELPRNSDHGAGYERRGQPVGHCLRTRPCVLLRRQGRGQ